MKNRARFCLREGLLALAFVLLAIGECTAGNAADGIARKEVSNIEVTIAEQNLEQFGVALSATNLAERVAKNLTDAHFPVHKANEKSFSHTLKAMLLPIKRQSTPVGFSFSAGNSDPRAHDFQKADVLTIECGLKDNRNPAKTVRQSMEFSANSLKKQTHKKKAGAQITKALVEQISTTCYNLLEDLHLDESAAAPGAVTVKRSGWMPQISIELQNEEPAPTKKEAGKVAPKPAPVEEPRKKLIIHNQGSPLIMKLGHERL